MLNRELRKTELRDDYGKILLPRTTASMVSEEPDRRFVDNVEKSFLNTITVYNEALTNLAKAEEQLLILVSQIDQILPGAAEKEAIELVASNITDLQVVADNAKLFKGLSSGRIEIPAEGSESVYALSVVEENGEPSLKLVKVESEEKED